MNVRPERPQLPLDLEFLANAGLGDPGAQPVIDFAGRARLLLYALRRRWKLAAIVFCACVAATAVLWKRTPRVYRAETRILAQRSDALPETVRTGAGREEPTKTASENIHRRDNLLALIKQTELFKPQPRAPSLRERLGLPPLGLRDPPPTQQDQLNQLVDALDGAILVATTDTTVTITVDWGDPQEAYRIVEASMQNFFESRQVQELNTIDEMIALLHARTDSLYREYQDVQEQVHKERAARASDEGTSSGGAPRLDRPAGARPTGARTEQIVQLRTLLEAKQRAIVDIEDFRRKRLSDLQAELDEKRGIYSDAFPNVVTLKQNIEALSKESPQVAALRAEAAKLAAELAARDPAAARALAGDPAGVIPVRAARAKAAPGPESVEQIERVREARFRYERMLERLSQAELALDAARAGFKYRYAIVTPAQVPREPIRPRRWLVLAAGAFFATLLASLAVVLADIRKGIIHESCQLQEILGVPLLGEITRP